MQIRGDIEFLLPILKEKSSGAKFILEVGSAAGDGSTTVFKEIMEKSKNKNRLYVSVDLEDSILPECRPQGFWWHLVIGDSRSPGTLNKVQEISKGALADVIFIDTEHNYDVMKKELEVWKNLAHNKTIWLFHDTWMSGSYNHMTDAIKEFSETDSRWEYLDLSKDNNGLGALVPVE